MVLTVEFTLAGNKFSGLNGGPQFPFTEAVSFQIACENQAEVDRLWTALSEGGSPGQCGWLKDRWGLSWQIVPTRLFQLLADPDPDRSRRAMQAMLKMAKLNIAELERAADGAWGPTHQSARPAPYWCGRVAAGHEGGTATLKAKTSDPRDFLRWRSSDPTRPPSPRRHPS
jgi:hypothetical protein